MLSPRRRPRLGGFRMGFRSLRQTAMSLRRRLVYGQYYNPARPEPARSSGETLEPLRV